MNFKLNIKIILLSLSFIIIAYNVTAKGDGYKISIKVKGIKDTLCYLVNYYGDKTYFTDTARVSENGKFVFTGNEKLPGGIYIFAGEKKNKYFEFIINVEQNFSITTDTIDLNKNIIVKGSPENTLFLNYMNFNIRKFSDITALRNKINIIENNTDSISILKEKINLINKEIVNYKLNIIEEHPKTFISVLFKAMKEPDIPEPPLLKNGRKDSTFAYRYYKAHYWDDIDLTDERLLRTPVFNNKLNKYFSKILVQHPDSIIKEADILIEKSRQNKEMFKYIIWYLTYTYETSDVMGFDEIFVHFVEKYYATGEAYWADSTIIKSITDRAAKLKPLLLNKTAPDLIMMDTNKQFVSMHHIFADFTLIFFYETDCGHCKKEINELKEFYDNNDFGLEVFAVCTDTSFAEWKKNIIENKLKWVNVNGTRSISKDYHNLYDIYSTPTIYILDKNKKIIAKRLITEQIKPFLENYIKRVKAF
ncbi:MAG: DUF5106 domain-containing protein [Bacteroidales bacterium]|nr:DUF5106 domain-containing protein [Bacteroidales bacterium]